MLVWRTVCRECPLQNYAIERNGTMLRLLLHWILNALALLVVSHFVEGFDVTNVVSAFIAVVVIGLLNATLGLFLKIITLPLGILTFGIFFLVINAVILWFSSKFVPGFAVTTFKAAFLGALALAVLHLLFGFFGKSVKK
jgi:putative membrane protein